MTNPKTILVADDDASIRTVLSHALRGAGYDVAATDNGATLFGWVVEGKGDLVITDVMMPGENGLDLIPKIQRRRPDMKVIVISAQNALTTAVTASERGALDFLPKPFDVDELLSTVQNALLQQAAPVKGAGGGTTMAQNKSIVVGQSKAMQEIYRTIGKLRSSDLTVLITGESGTGKEVVARALHEFSARKEKPFVAVNMAAIPRELIESELFGHEKGAFTGATQKTQGKFEQAAGGTLFLDEIGDMPYEAQTRLLRVLQEGEFTAVGGRKLVKSTARIVAATNKDLSRLVREGAFREDLYYRLNVVPLRVPPLRERKEDIPALVQHFIGGAEATKVFDESAMYELKRQAWPGNIRELENFIRRFDALYSGTMVTSHTLHDELMRANPPSAPGSRGVSAQIKEAVEQFFIEGHGKRNVHALMMEKLDRALIEKMLQTTNGNQIKAAEMLGLNRNTLRAKIRDLGIEVTRK
jgi:two-component system, NtrC family, nitrogen regulation response regulator GlnG